MLFFRLPKLIAFFIILEHVTGTPIHNVSLTWEIQQYVISLKCYIQNMGLGVFFYDPKGNEKGHCTSPLLVNNINKVGECDSGMSQTILPNKIVLNELSFQLSKCENGLWKCSHGNNRNEEDVKDVSMAINLSCSAFSKSVLERFLYYTFPAMCIGYVAGYCILYTLNHICTKNNGTTHCCKRNHAGTICWRYASKKLFSVIAVLIVTILTALIPEQYSMICSVITGTWSVVIGTLEVLLFDKCLSCIEEKICPTTPGQDQPAEAMHTNVEISNTE